MVMKAKSGKASGIDEIPVELLKNDVTIKFMHCLFNICYKSGKVPTLWSTGIINLIPKSGNKEPRDPMSYRGITLILFLLYVKFTVQS